MSDNTAISEDGTPSVDPRELARATALSVAEEPEQVGDVIDAIDLGDGVTDFRLAAHVRGYEGWQWSVTLYHDVELGDWTVNESSLIPTDDALMPPAWVPWKDRLEPTDLAPTDSIGTDPDDPRLEDGFRRTEPVADAAADDAAQDAQDATSGEDASEGDGHETSETSPEDDGERDAAVTAAVDESEDEAEAVEEFDLSRRHVLSQLGRAQTAKRWYEGPRGPKAMSTKTAAGNLCSTCGFLVPIKGELNRMFGVCANKWSPDDGRVVSLDHGCGEHSEIDPPEPSRLWVQSKPAFDDLHIDIIAQQPREEREPVELIEQADAEDDNDTDVATEQDIEENTEIDADSKDVADNTVEPDDEPELEAVVDLAATTDETETPASDESGTETGETMTEETATDAAEAEPTANGAAQETAESDGTETEPAQPEESVPDEATTDVPETDVPEMEPAADDGTGETPDADDGEETDEAGPEPEPSDGAEPDDGTSADTAE
ncbi:DUF3027 domain-containing protein [Bifidobacterium saguinibicoloris]|uniref:DUF3027 domain-containing protein n=1 Tax=Bifidobacterium saguinibicoloris TaxID=2834433 RepID=UPI001C56D586|nr:DUF3027 domain-containing protein [Bifidobacterium saguinibicoloris]MBW3080615.1 DUF3027 domain-containing protein [Bifidobacterium saguinibicoloris]